MGYVHDTAFSQFITPEQFNHSAGTWTVSVASNVLKSARTAADATWNTHVSIRVPSNSVALKGCRLKSIDVYYTIGTAACDDFATVELEKVTYPAATGSAPTGAAVSAVTIDTGHDTAAERKATGDHKMTITLDTPAWIDNDEAYVLLMAVDAAATSVFTFWGARVNYDLRA